MHTGYSNDGKHKKQEKLLIAEFNTFASPTTKSIRLRAEDLLDLKWTGWIGRYFSSLDSNNKDLPRWVYRNYQVQHKTKWTFKKSGIVFVHENEDVVVLEYPISLNKELPTIVTNNVNRNKYNLPEKINYPFWFDIMLIKRNNKAISVYELSTNTYGDSILKSHGIPKRFPAAIECGEKEGLCFYFAGDFADNPIKENLIKFRGIEFFKPFLYSPGDKVARGDFFWNYYDPIMSKILKDYYSTLPEKQ